MLVHRTLMHRRKTSRADVVASIERNMFCLEPPVNAQGDMFVRQERLIDLLAEMEREDGGNDIERLTEKYVVDLEHSATDVAKSASGGSEQHNREQPQFQRYASMVASEAEI